MHVLLVEDNALVASGVRAGLQLQGFGVVTVASAGQADAAIRSSHFDACVLDLGLPDEDGLSLLARWRGQGLQVPVLVLTARDAVSQRIEGLQTGADDYLVKPFDLHELAARLHALLRRAAGRSVDWIELGEVRINPAAGHIHLPRLRHRHGHARSQQPGHHPGGLRHHLPRDRRRPRHGRCAGRARRGQAGRQARGHHR